MAPEPLATVTDPVKIAPVASAVANAMLPEDDVPSPVDSVNVPPVDVAPDATPDVIVTGPPTILAALVWPPDSTNAPPTPDLPVPTAMEIEPPRPLLAELPVPMYSHPVLPTVAKPVLNTIAPLLPDFDAVLVASAVWSTSLPLDDIVLLPEVTNTSPPLEAAAVEVDLPADNVRLPP